MSLADYFCSRRNTQWRFFNLLRTNIRERKTGRSQKASIPVYSDSTKEAPTLPASRDPKTVAAARILVLIY